MFLVLALVTGFINLPSYMIPDSSEVLYEFLHLAGEVDIIMLLVIMCLLFC